MKLRNFFNDVIAGSLHWSIVLIFLLCTGCGFLKTCTTEPTEEVTEVELHGLKFRFPNRYFRFSYEAQYLHHVALGVPVSELPIIPDDPGFGRPSVDLMLSSISFHKEMTHSIDAYETTHREAELENGMVVLTDPKRKKNAFWVDDVLYPESGEQVYFICARPWVDGLGRHRDVLCTAYVDFDQTISAPRIELSYSIPRKDLARWKMIDAQVRTFINRFAVK